MAIFGRIGVATEMCDDLHKLVAERIEKLVATFDTHDPSVFLAADIGATADKYQCPTACSGFMGTKEQWEHHLAELLADAFGWLIAAGLAVIL